MSWIILGAIWLGCGAGAYLLVRRDPIYRGWFLGVCLLFGIAALVIEIFDLIKEKWADQ